MKKVVLALDLGGTKLASAIFDANGKIFHKELVPLEKRTGKQVGALIRDQIAKAQSFNFSAVGISVPGISYQKSGTVWAPNIPGWKNYPLRAEILSQFQRKKIPVKIESDRACYILGESWKGAAQGCSDAIFLAVGTGIGAGILVNGQILRGANDIAGAIGWLALQKPFRADYASCGCFEHHASGEGLMKVAKELIGLDKHYSRALKRNGNFSAHDLFTTLKDGDPIAKTVFDQAIEFWGMAAANLVSLFAPEKIIFGGGVFGPAVKFLPRILREAKKWAQPVSIQNVQFLPSALGGDAGLFGAAYVAWRNLNVSGRTPKTKNNERTIAALSAKI